MVAQVPDNTAADLEAFFNDDTAAFHNGTGRLCNGDQSLQGTTVGKEIVNDQHVLTGMEEADKIVSVPRDRMDKPLEPQKIASIRVDTKGAFYPFDQL